MFYPLKFKPIYKNYMWGGRNLENLGKDIPEGIVAESWELSCHPDGVSIISNGEFEGMTLPHFIKKFGKQVIGTDLPESDIEKFPLLIKFIDANANLSVQVHPDNEYANVHENGELGKNEVWYVINTKPGSKLIYGVVPGLTKDTFTQEVSEGKIENCLNYIDVFPGDTVSIPAGLVHNIGEGIVLLEVQQTSNVTYRVYDYDRVDNIGNKRPLHFRKALDVMNFDTKIRAKKAAGLKVNLGVLCSKTFKIATKYFSLELYEVNGSVQEIADVCRFHIYTFIKGYGEIAYGNGTLMVKAGDTVLIPAAMGAYTLTGDFTALKSYVPDIHTNIIIPLKNAGYSEDQIYDNVGGLSKD